MAHEWDRVEGESAKAYAAFCKYRDLKPDRRSLNAAYGGGRAPGYWAEWSSQFRWVERAAAYDAHLDELRRSERERRLRALEERRFAVELQNQERLEKRLQKMEALLDKADQAPIVEVSTRKETEKVTIKVKGISLAGYARLVDAANTTAKQAINGVRDEPEAAEKDGDATVVQGEFEWVKPEEPDSGGA